MKVLVLHDVVPPDAPPDQVDALHQAELVRQIMTADGHEVRIEAFSLDPSSIVDYGPDVVFNLVETVGGDGRLAHLAPAVLETLGIPFTGSGSAALAVSSHKRLCKRVLAAAGVEVPDDWPNGGPRWIVKSLWEHASIGLDDSCIVGGDEVAAARERLAPRMGGEVVAETYVDGRELNVSLLETDAGLVVLPIAEIRFRLPPGRANIVGYAAKWTPGSVEWDGTERSFDVPDVDTDAIARLCRRAWVALDCRGYVRVDLRVPTVDGRTSGPPVVLEVNANPCLAADAGFAAAVERGGLTLSEAVRAIVGRALGTTDRGEVG